MKKTWALINELRGKTKNKIKSCFKIDGKLVMSQREISKGFNEYFSSIARTMNAKTNSSRPTDQSSDTSTNFIDFLSKRKRIIESIFLYECSSEDVLRVIREFECDKASDISVSFEKNCTSYIRTSLRFH